MSLRKITSPGRIFASVFVLLTFAVAGMAAGGTASETAQDWDMTWSGRVDATARITIRARSVRTQTVSGRNTTGINYNVRRRLPTNRAVRVVAEKREGRGRVRVVQQPSRFNNYTARFEVYDSSGGADFYRVELFWEEVGGDGGFERPGNVDFNRNAQFTWQGRVDERTRIRVRNRNATTQTISGRNTTNVRYDFRSALNSNTGYVRLNRRDGRGSVRIIEQPSRRNGWSAVVEIYDGSGGADFYAFELFWDRNNFPTIPGTGSRGSMTWRGRVDATTQISIRGNRATTRTISGSRTTNVSFNFLSSLPRSSSYVTVRRRDGRGSVRVIQQPNRFNNYTAIVEIRDPRSGRDDYDFELSWSRGNSAEDRPPVGRNGSMFWKGSVDGEALITIRRGVATTRTISGSATRNVSYNFTNPLPRRNTVLRLDKRDGRGTVRILQQPNRLNNYTAIIQISDPRGGRDSYEFELEW